MVAEGYLTEGSLTVFSGIPFGEKNPYSYREAKRLLKLALQQLRTRQQLKEKLGMDSDSGGRPAITGRDRSSVWDFLPLKQCRGEAAFTKCPHLTMSIEQDRLACHVTIPNGIKGVLRRNLLDGGRDAFVDLILGVQKNMNHALHSVQGAVPSMYIVQRRYQTQSSEPIVDARLEFDLRTAFSGSVRRHADITVKSQAQWLQTVYEVFSSKQSNLQLGVGAVFPYDRCKAVGTPEILDCMEAVWLACRPLIQRIFKT